jgi:hypothetical protein
MKLQGKKTAEAPVETSDDKENEELFRKYITSPGLKEKNIENNKKKGISQNTMVATALLIVAFVVGIGFGIYTLNIPEEVSSVSLYTNDSAFPPFVLNNTTNSTTNVTNKTNSTKMLNTTKKVTTPVPQPTQKNTTTTNNTTQKAAGDPGTKKAIKTSSSNSSP